MSAQLYTVKYGININGNVHLLEGTATPTIVSVIAPVGSFYTKTSTGQFYRRAIDDWELISSYSDLDTFNKFKVVGVTTGSEILLYEVQQLDLVKYSTMMFEVLVEDAVDRSNKYAVSVKTLNDYENDESVYTEHGTLNIGNSNIIQDVAFRTEVVANKFSLYATITSDLTTNPMNIYFSRVVVAAI